MMKAFNTFDIARGYKFTSYATMIMQNEILMALRKKDAIKYAISLEEPVHESLKDNSELTLMDTLEDTADSVEEQAEDRFVIDLIIKRGKEFLNEREYFIVMNYLKEGRLNQQGMAQQMGISQSYVSRLFAKAINKIRNVVDGKLIHKPEQTIKEKESERTMEAVVQEHIIEIPEGTLYEKIKQIHEKYPNMHAKEIAELLKCNVNSVRSYMSQVKRELESSAENKNNISAPKEEPVVEFKEQSAPSVNQSPSPNYISLSLEGASAESIQFMLKSIASALQGNESYSLNIDITKKAKEDSYGHGSQTA